VSGPTIRVIIPWFGPWPFWLPAFLRSCEVNRGVCWSLFGDHPLPCAAPANVEFEQIEFGAYCERVSKALGIRFAPDSPYKLCDLKPALGAVHRELLGDCDYWAFSDLDLVYGDLLGHFGPLLDRWQIISTHHTRISGHFCLLRNDERCIEAYRTVSGWREMLEAPEHRFFDEAAFSQRLLPHKKWPRWLRVAVYRGDPMIRGTRFHEEFTTPRAGGRHPWIFGHEPLPTCWSWRPGSLTTDLTGERRFPYFHFLGWKSDAWRGRPSASLWHLDQAALASGWQMTRDGFWPLPVEGRSA
jgi:hypothetical protein